MYIFIYIYTYLYVFIRMVYIQICVCVYMCTAKPMRHTWTGVTVASHVKYASSSSVIPRDCITLFFPKRKISQGVAVSCVVMQCAALGCDALQSVVVCCRVVQCVAVCRSVSRCVAVLLLCVAVHRHECHP